MTELEGGVEGCTQVGRLRAGQLQVARLRIARLRRRGLGMSSSPPSTQVVQEGRDKHGEHRSSKRIDLGICR